MWEQEFCEFAATAKMGYLTKPEWEKAWETMVGEAWNHKGPRGFLRLWVKTKDIGESCNDVSSAKKLQKQETLKRPTEKQMRDRFQMVYSDATDEATDSNLDFNVLKEEVLKASGTGGAMPSFMEVGVSDMMGDADDEVLLRVMPSRAKPARGGRVVAKVGRLARAEALAGMMQRRRTSRLRKTLHEAAGPCATPWIRLRRTCPTWLPRSGQTPAMRRPDLSNQRNSCLHVNNSDNFAVTNTSPFEVFQLWVQGGAP